MCRSIFKYIFLFSFGFLFSFIFFYVMQPIYCDEVWVYGFSYNISKGMIIYRDFNVLQMPLYFFIASLFIKIFGNYIIVIHIFDSLLFATMLIMLSKIIHWKVLILLPIFIFWWPSGYNLLCLFFLILIIYLINQKKDCDYLIAFLIGLCFITKQNIGLCLLLPCLFYSKNKIKTILIFIIPFLVLSIYMIYYDAFYNFIDYCFLGMFEFGEKNLNYSIFWLLFVILNILFLLLMLFRSKFRDKEIFYILIFQLITYPIFDIRHVICSFFPVMYLILKKISSRYICFLIAFFVYSLYFSLFISVNYSINFDKNILYLRNSRQLDILIDGVVDYVGENENFFFVDYYSYLIKLYSDIPISQYDLLLSGNVGYKGMEKKLKQLDELCLVEKCYFFSEYYPKDDIVGSQYQYFHQYIVSNYQKVDSLFEFDIYTNVN